MDKNIRIVNYITPLDSITPIVINLDRTFNIICNSPSNKYKTYNIQSESDIHVCQINELNPQILDFQYRIYPNILISTPIGFQFSIDSLIPNVTVKYIHMNRGFGITHINNRIDSYITINGIYNTYYLYKINMIEFEPIENIKYNCIKKSDPTINIITDLLEIKFQCLHKDAPPLYDDMIPLDPRFECDSYNKIHTFKSNILYNSLYNSLRFNNLI